MAIVTRTTTSSGTRTTTTSSIPMWLVKLITVILCSVILFIIYLLDNSVRTYYARTFILIGLTCGALLGWSIGSVLQQFLSYRNVEIIINLILTALSGLSAILLIIYLVETNDSSGSQRFKLMIGAAVSFVIQAFVCLLTLSWAWYGNVIIVRSV
ncbi:unnamed protein product, partial [Mesorhabditis belari]|uniref:Uncharacterized protein n=1 Tax=Mesorhabditis belari TaxID=2138241 RepID=A0AAF3J1M7_9BILA